MATVKFIMFAGDTKVLEVSVTEAGAAVDISGTSIRWHLALSIDDEALVEKATGAGITIVDGPGGRFDVLLDPADTQALAGTYYYEAEIDDGGVISTVLTGTMHINKALIDPP